MSPPPGGAGGGGCGSSQAIGIDDGAVKRPHEGLGKCLIDQIAADYGMRFCRLRCGCLPYGVGDTDSAVGLYQPASAQNPP